MAGGAIRDLFQHKKQLAYDNTVSYRTRNDYNEQPYRAAKSVCYLLVAVAGAVVYLLATNRVKRTPSMHSVIVTIIVVMLGGSYIISMMLTQYRMNMLYERNEDLVQCRQKIDTWIAAMRDTQSNDIKQLAAGMGGLVATTHPAGARPGLRR